MHTQSSSLRAKPSSYMFSARCRDDSDGATWFSDTGTGLLTIRHWVSSILATPLGVSLSRGGSHKLPEQASITCLWRRENTVVLRFTRVE